MKNHQKTYFAVFSLFLALLTGCGRGEQMRQRMEFVAECNRADTVFTARWLPTVDSLVDYFRRHGTDNERLMAYYLQGRVLHDIGEAPQALDAYQRATEQADTTRDDCDLRTLYSVYGQMANLFHAQYLPDNEMKALQTAERIAWKNGDTFDALVAFVLRSRPYYIKGEKDSVMVIEKQARELYLKHGYKQEAAQAMLGTISILLDREQYEDANRYIQIFEQESGWFDSDGNIMEGKELCYYDKGRYLLAAGKTDSALLYFQKTLNGGWPESGNRGLLAVYEKKNISDSIAKYAKLFASANDSSYLHVNQEKVHQVSAMYDYSRHQRIAAEEANKAKIRKYAIFGILFLGLLTATAVYSKYRREQRVKVAEINRLTSDYHSAKTTSQRLSEDLAMLAGIKEVNEKMIQERQIQIDDLNDKILEYERLLQSHRADEKLMALKQCEIVEHFNRKKHPTLHYSAPSGQDWKKLNASFVKYLPQFASALEREFRLSEQEQRICLLEILGFSTGEMAMVLDTTSQVVTNAKASANQKIFSQNKASTLGKNLKNRFLV